MQVLEARTDGSVPRLRHPTGIRRAHDASGPRHINVHHQERLLSALAGGLAVAWGLSRRSPGGTIAAALGSGFVYRGISGHCHLYEALGLSTANDLQTSRLPMLHRMRPRHYEVLRSVSIQKTPEQIYTAWKDPKVLAQVMHHLAQVEVRDAKHTRWTLRDPLGHEHAFETVIAEDTPNERIRWTSAPGEKLTKSGSLSLRAAPGDRGTEATLHLHFERPAGLLGDLLERVLGPIPSLIAQRALNNLKCLLEAGELPALSNNPSARAM
jgi:uncharacterized membrane protein